MTQKPIVDLLDAMGAQALPCIHNEPLAQHTTFRIGGPAAVFCKPRTVAELTRVPICWATVPTPCLPTKGTKAQSSV